MEAFANVVSLLVIVGTIGLLVSQETRRRWRRRKHARGRPVEPYLGDLLPPES
jgi:hypothetical protein